MGSNSNVSVWGSFAVDAIGKLLSKTFLKFIRIKIKKDF